MIRNHLLSTYSAETAKRTLKQMNACCNWAVLSKLIEVNSFNDLAKGIKTKRKDSTILTFNFLILRLINYTHLLKSSSIHLLCLLQFLVPCQVSFVYQ